jgi:zinc transporter, ZIP family
MLFIFYHISASYIFDRITSIYLRIKIKSKITMTNVLISAAGLCGATIIGAILGFFVKELPHKWNDAVLGYCAGIMLAASTLGLIVPAFEQTGLWWLVVIGVMAGALFLNVLDLVTPHLHHITGLDPEEHRNNARLSHVMLFVMAIRTAMVARAS